MSYYFLSLQEVLKPFCNLLATTFGVALDGIAYILAKETQELVHLVDLLVLEQPQSLTSILFKPPHLLQHDVHSYGRPVTSEMIVVSGECLSW